MSKTAGNEKSAGIFADAVHACGVGHNDELCKLLSQAPGLATMVSADNNTLLHVAAAVGRMDMMLTLLLKGAPIDAQDTEGFSPLMVALQFRREECANILLEQGASVNLINAQQHTPLHIAAIFGALGSIKPLLHGEAPINALDSQGRTPLLCAMSRASMSRASMSRADRDVILLLLAHPDVSLVDGDLEGNDALTMLERLGIIDPTGQLLGALSEEEAEAPEGEEDAARALAVKDEAAPALHRGILKSTRRSSKSSSSKSSSKSSSSNRSGKRDTTSRNGVSIEGKEEAAGAKTSNRLQWVDQQGQGGDDDSQSQSQGRLQAEAEDTFDALQSSHDQFHDEYHDQFHDDQTETSSVVSSLTANSLTSSIYSMKNHKRESREERAATLALLLAQKEGLGDTAMTSTDLVLQEAAAASNQGRQHQLFNARNPHKLTKPSAGAGFWMGLQGAFLSVFGLDTEPTKTAAVSSSPDPVEDADAAIAPQLVPPGEWVPVKSAPRQSSRRPIPTSEVDVLQQRLGDVARRANGVIDCNSVGAQQRTRTEHTVASIGSMLFCTGSSS